MQWIIWLACVIVLIASIVQAVQGDWAPALFLVVLWHGLTNNSNALGLSRSVSRL